MTDDAKTLSSEEIGQLNSKLWEAAEAGDAELIRKLVEDGADVNSAPFVPDDEDEDDDTESFTTVSVSEMSQEAPAEAKTASDGTIEKPKACLCYACYARICMCYGLHVGCDFIRRGENPCSGLGIRQAGICW